MNAPVQLQGPNGPMPATVTSMNETAAVLDFNHPLAGLPLTMSVTLFLVLSMLHGFFVGVFFQNRSKRQSLMPGTPPSSILGETSRIKSVWGRAQLSFVILFTFVLQAKLRRFKKWWIWRAGASFGAGRRGVLGGAYRPAPKPAPAPQIHHFSLVSVSRLFSVR